MQIVHYPHPALRYQSVDIRQIDNTLRRTVEKMFDLMYEARGIGLAANQVGLPFRFFIVNLGGRPDEDNEEFVFINPIITKRRGFEQGEEGCLSLPGLYADVERSAEVTIEAYDLDGQGFAIEVDELAARVVQHESDHLDGIMFTDKLCKASQKEDVAEELQRFVSRFEEMQLTATLPATSALEAEVREMAQSGLIPADFPDRPPVKYWSPNEDDVKPEA